MSARETVERYLSALQRHSLKEVEELLSDELEFVTPVETLDKQAFVEFIRGLFAGFPDWRFEHGPLFEDGEVVSTRLRMSGTHTGILDLPLPGLKPLDPTGKAVTLPEQRFDYVVAGARIIRIEGEPVPHAGVIGMLEQIGARLPPLWVMRVVSRVRRLLGRGG